LYAKLAQGKITLDSDREAAFYEFAWDYLPSAGLNQYEVSNYAKEGYQCRHNLNTWRMNDWIGYGPSASSQYKKVRWKNYANIEQWAKPLLLSTVQQYEEHTQLTERELASDSILFGLRMNDGINLTKIGEQFGIESTGFTKVHAFFELLVKEKLADRKKDTHFLTSEGRMRCDAIATEMPEFG
jgi:oxygen-independent coproporphyrinogen-3 oxidase